MKTANGEAVSFDAAVRVERRYFALAAPARPQLPLAGQDYRRRMLAAELLDFAAECSTEDLRTLRDAAAGWAERRQGDMKLVAGERS